MTFYHKVLDESKQVFYKHSCFRSAEAGTLMKVKTLFATILTLALLTVGYPQTVDKAKLDQFFDRLAEKNKAMGSLTITKDGYVLHSRAIGYSQINGTEKKALTAANR
jgi:D-alanyl-D-alanine carboxypeptidase